MELLVFNNNIDCILLDSDQVALENVSCLKKVMEHPKKEVPIILLINKNQERIAFEALELGVKDYLIKSSLGPELLHKTLASVFGEDVDQDREEKVVQYSDFLTGLPSKALFQELVLKSLSNARRYRYQLAVFFIDLNQFENVNKAIKYEKGDLLLKQIVKRFQSVLRISDTLARVGGDEFAVLVEHIRDAEDADLIARKIIEALEEPFLIENYSVTINSSIGVSIYPQFGKSMVELVDNANRALHDIKNTLFIFPCEVKPTGEYAHPF